MPYFFNIHLCKPLIHILDPILYLDFLFLGLFLPHCCLFLYLIFSQLLDPPFDDDMLEPDWVLQVSPVNAVVFKFPLDIALLFESEF